ncbi:MAG: ferritin family protein [Candidatus Omnitrophica bacterium]|nr:ferritin family protein [Candidatus Omnitrophota bacterium]MDD5352957.1 ferritin family protein [Candidatus Omnitrophota bacterium]MDD5550556.1 ferritin family protein [Candidatus Omnitrophota bacterium]
MGPVEALELALSKEKEAIELYQKFYREFAAAKDIFLFLANEEQKHRNLIEKKISELKTE